jgi:hypothetical protein
MFQPPITPHFISFQETLKQFPGLYSHSPIPNPDAFFEDVPLSETLPDILTEMCGGTQEKELAYLQGVYRRHELLGHPVIAPDLHLSRALSQHTDLKSVKDKFPELPQQTVWIAFPQGLDFFIHGSSLKPQRASGMYIFKHRSGAWLVYVWAPGNKKDRIPYISSVYVHTWVYPGVDIDEDLANRMCDVDTGLDGVLDKQRFGDIFDWKPALRFACGVLQYMGCSNADVETSTPTDRELDFTRRHGNKRNPSKGRAGHERKTLDRFGHSTVIYIGRGWARTTEGRSFADATTGRSGPRLHLVRGHMRDQPYGPERSLVKRIFIAPHVRGESLLDADVPGATYRVR